MGAKKESVLCTFYNLPSGTPGEYGTGQRIVLDKKALFQFLTECQDVSQEIYDKWWSYQYPAELHADWQYVVSIVNTYLEKHGINAWDFEWLADRYLLTQNVLTSKLISEAHLLSRTISEKTYIYRVQKTFQTKEDFRFDFLCSFYDLSKDEIIETSPRTPGTALGIDTHDIYRKLVEEILCLLRGEYIVQRCAAENCQKIFRHRGNKRFCSSRCRDRIKMRVRRKTERANKNS